MALKEEAKSYFNDYKILFTGVGKINATYKFVEEIQKNKPEHIINLGSAGSPFFKAGSVVNATKFIQRDMDVQALGFAQYQTPYEPGSELVKYGERYSSYQEAICGTGDSFDTSGHHDQYNVVDMEAFALAKISKVEGLKFSCLKFISDGADGAAHKDWSLALEDGAQKLSQALKKILE